MDIRCRKTTCSFNNDNTCFAKRILIEKNAFCSSFVQKEEINESKKDLLKKTEDTSKVMFEKPSKNGPMRNRKKIEIGCKASCLFNINGVCRANGITINDINLPICMGYLPK